jgi:hypothetical protein
VHNHPAMIPVDLAGPGSHPASRILLFNQCRAHGFAAGRIRGAIGPVIPSGGHFKEGPRGGEISNTRHTQDDLPSHKPIQTRH